MKKIATYTLTLIILVSLLSVGSAYSVYIPGAPPNAIALSCKPGCVLEARLSNTFNPAIAYPNVEVTFVITSIPLKGGVVIKASAKAFTSLSGVAKYIGKVGDVAYAKAKIVTPSGEITLVSSTLTVK